LSEPTVYEQYMLELINAARVTAGVQPLANNGKLNDAADAHVDWMISSNTLSHTGAGGSSAYDRMVDAGFVFSGASSWGENIVWESLRGAAGYADEVRDLHNWLMNSPGHKANILNAKFTQVGIGFDVGPFKGWQSAVAAEDFVGTSQHFLTGVAYEDIDGDRAYDPGEGLAGLTVTAIGSTGAQFVVKTYGSGGYDLALAAGTYTVTISGSNIAPFTKQVTIGLTNVKLDLVNPGAATAPAPAPSGGVTVNGTAYGDLINTTTTVAGQLKPGANADTLNGLAGNDTLDGGAGADRLDGGAGNDNYYVDNAGDVVVETLTGSTGGTADKVFSSVSFTLGANVERLTLSGSASVNGTGNSLDNVLYANGGANSLSGLAGADIISGYAGNDTLRGGTGADTLNGGAGADRFVFAKGEAAGDRISDFASDDLIQLTGYGAGSTITKVSGSTTDWVIRDGVTGQTEILKLANGYTLGSGDFIFS
jgi:serralysin